jgi:hypothetical protein
MLETCVGHCNFKQFLENIANFSFLKSYPEKIKTIRAEILEMPQT